MSQADPAALITDTTAYERAFDASAAKSDTTDFTNYTRALYVGGTGDVKIDTVGGDTVTFKTVPAGAVLRIRAKRLYSTGTTATTILGLW